MSDLISRQAAIDAIERLEIPEDMCVFEILSHIELEIGNLPSAQPEIIRCKDCKHWNDAPAADGLNSCEMDALIRHESFFCANGERKEGEQNA